MMHAVLLLLLLGSANATIFGHLGRLFFLPPRPLPPPIFVTRPGQPITQPMLPQPILPQPVLPQPILPQPGFPFPIGGIPKAEPTLGSAEPFELIEPICSCTSRETWQRMDVFSPREISNLTFAQDPTEDIPDPRGLSTFAWVFGQFIDHDLVDSILGTELMAEAFNDQIKITVQRVETVARGACQNIKSKRTAALDLSPVYGDARDPSILEQLRDKTHRCKLREGPGGSMPLSSDGTQFLAGDHRASENALLTMIQLLWLREHNRLCDELSQELPGWSPEELFWKARQINIAEYQRLIYFEWLPAIFGSQLPLLHNTQPRKSGLGISMEFSAAAYRFGHTLVNNEVGRFRLFEMFDSVNFFKRHSVEDLIRAASVTRSQRVDNKIVNSMRNFLFGRFGIDLVTINLMRGRDVGVGTYRQVSACFGTQPVQMNEKIPDLFAGLLSEPLALGSSIPRTIALIFADQFQRLKLHDPNFFLNLGERTFGLKQWQQINRSTLSSMIRLNFGMQVKENAFFV